MGSWVALLGKKRSDDETAAIRAAVVREWSETWGEMKFTCDDCPAKNTCEFAFDPYNTGGDCLAEK